MGKTYNKNPLNTPILLVVLMIATACKKEDIGEKYYGTYSGISITTQPDSTFMSSKSDTSFVSIILEKFKEKKELWVKANFASQSYLYKATPEGIEVGPDGCYHCPSITMAGDSLYAKWQIGLGDIVTRFELKKNN